MYLNNYIKSIDFALKNSSYLIKGKNFDGNTFFEKLKMHTQFLKKNNSRIFFFGNGASAAFSNHMALDWSKNGGINSFSLSDSALLTALSNDYNFEDSFLEFLKIYNPTQNDFVVTTSSSGNSKNIINILKYCKKNNIPTLALSGLNKKNMSIDYSDFSIFVPMKTYGIVECVHQIFHHIWLDFFMGIEEWNKIESQNMDSSNFNI